MLPWIRDKDNPIVPVVPGTWKETYTANLDLLEWGDKLFIYFRGNQGGHNRIGVAFAERAGFNGKNWQEYENNPILDVGKPGEFDEGGLLDPSTVLVNGKVFLYYRGHREEKGKCVNGVGLATSDDGIHFEKYAGSPVAGGVGCTEVVYQDGLFYLFLEEGAPPKAHVIYLLTSSDGYHYQGRDLVLDVGPERTWDSFDIVTPRIFKEGDFYYMVYGGDDRHSDYPKFFGLARSQDLRTWSKYSGNPIFSRGEKGSWDDGAMWFGTIYSDGEKYFMWYEGWGGAPEQDTPYAPGGKSQLGLATLPAGTFPSLNDWDLPLAKGEEYDV